MIKSFLRFQIERPIPSFPRPATLGVEVQDRQAYRFAGARRKDDAHCIFQYTLSGLGMFRDAYGEHRIEAGSGFLCESNDPDTAYWYPADAQGPWHFIYTGFVGEAAHTMVRDLVGRFGGVYRLPPGRGIIKRLLSYHSDEHGDYPINASAGARMVMDLLATLAARSQAIQETDPDNVLVLRAQEFIRDFVDNNLNVSDLSQNLKVSREHLTRVFKDQTGVTPYQYIVRKKMLLACHLLKEENLTVQEIAMRLGFEIPAHFTRTFKRVIKMTPKRFREAGIIPVL